MESKKVEFFNKLSFSILLLTVFVSIFFFIPYSPVSLETSKGFLVAIGSTLSLFFWFIARLGEGKFVIPKDRLILFAGLIPLVFLASSLFSSSLYISLFGGGFEIGTFGSMLIMFTLFFLSAVYFQSEKRIGYFIGNLFVAGFLVILFQVSSLFVDFNKILPGFLQGVSFGNLIGSWNNFVLFTGIIVLLAVFTLELLKTKKIFKTFQYILLVLGLIFLMIVNMPLVWSLVGFFSLVIFVYRISVQHSKIKTLQEGNKNKFPFISLIVVFLSLVFLVGNNLFGDIIANYISFNNPDIRPSITTTAQIGLRSFLHNPVLGTGPNTFSIDWALWQPKDLAQTIFWSVDFSNGYSLFSTLSVTTGLFGLISLLLFLVSYVLRSIQSIKIGLQNNLLNYFIMVILMVSLYSWASIIAYNPNIVMLTLAFVSSGMLVGALVLKQTIKIKEYSFLSDPRKSFFSILGLVVLMVASVSLTYVYIEKFTSIIYYSKSLNSSNSIDSLLKEESMLLKAISLDKNDIYYRSLSQVYLAQIGTLINDKTISQDLLKSSLQQLVNNTQGVASLAINQNPKNYLNYLNLGNIYTELASLSIENSYENAVLAYDRASSLAPNNPAIILSKASLEFINKNNSEARKYISQSLELKPNYIDAIFLLVQIETNEGNLAEAIKQAEYAGELAPNDAFVFFRLGLLRYNSGDYVKAVSAFEKAVVLDNSYLNARYYLGQSYKKVGRINDASTQFNILNQIIPNNEEILSAINSINMPIQNGEESDEKITADSNTKPPLKEKN